VTDTTHSHRREKPKSALVGWFKTRRRGLLTVILVLATIVGAYVLGLQMSFRELANAKQLVLQLQTESQKFKDQTTLQKAKVLALQTTTAKLAATLNALTPSKDTYQIVANQSLIVANGRLTVGLVGPPTNLGITININGKQQTVASGDVVEVAVDASTRCHVRVQAFDMFTALVTATCP
jgi:uncharacterized membrane protein affecting hemolysin expression